ncbi:MAG: ABC transporter ATP-binding protein [Deltaproteobacteria bacterium]|nr:ABC transporter ATP-binding protein [Deltaproteobacteria bacterium]
MSKVELSQISKVIQGEKILDSISLEVRHGEFVSLLGPSGCGKTTTLRITAGLTLPTAGRVKIGERVVCDMAEKRWIPPDQRNIGMVFQSYAIWPHMSVYENVSYPLRVRGIKKAIAKEKAGEVLDLVGLSGLERRFPHELSGGQQQRVALARALAMEPSVLLLDEPLSNLDAKLRIEMRGEIRRLQKNLSMTVLYVTHDQTEALSMSDRVAVMNRGRICQIGTPEEIQIQPADSFVKEFLSSN